MSPEDMFLDWLIGLPEATDPAIAARAKLDQLQGLQAPSLAEARLSDLLRQVTPFALATRRRRGEARRWARG